jgi:glycerol-3-phosphate dehydrogenase
MPPEPSRHDTAQATPVPPQVDVLVVGGGINGAGIARDLAGRGWQVLLCERDDLAGHTSSSSTKLIHGGLRYLEHYEFALVRKALQEREVLLKSAPHIMWPLRFVMPHDPAMRPAWMIRAGLFLYDHLAHREMLPGSNGIDLRHSPIGAPLKEQYTHGFEYSDGWVDDARLVLLNALDARERGATVLTRTPCTHVQRSASGWTAKLQTPQGTHTVQARALVNAAGPWADHFLRHAARPAGTEALATQHLRLVKGSHIVVRRLFEHDHAYIFQNPDKRIAFAIPYEREFTLIGTTDVELPNAWLHTPGPAQVDDAEVAYLCEQSSRYFKQPVTPADVVWRYAGVRPLLDDESGDASAVTRDYLLEPNTEAAPLLSVWGGKITTFRKLAEDAANLVDQMLADQPALADCGTGHKASDRAQRQAFRPGPAWTATAHLPGGHLEAWIGPAALPDADFAALVQAAQTRYPFVPPELAHRLCRAYGSRIDHVLGKAESLTALGVEVAPDLFESELHYLVREEWACTAEDVLWRRSKLGLHLTPAQRQAVDHWFAQRVLP